MDSVDMTTVLTALTKFNSRCFSGDRQRYGASLVDTVKNNMDEFRGICEEVEFKFASEKLWNTMLKTAKKEGKTPKQFMHVLNNGSYNKDALHTGMSKMLGEEIPLAYFNRFIDVYVPANVSKYMAIAARTKSIEDQISSLKGDLKYHEDLESQLLGGN